MPFFRKPLRGALLTGKPKTKKHLLTIEQTVRMNRWKRALQEAGFSPSTIERIVAEKMDGKKIQKYAESFKNHPTHPIRSQRSFINRVLMREGNAEELRTYRKQIRAQQEIIQRFNQKAAEKLARLEAKVFDGKKDLKDVSVYQVQTSAKRQRLEEKLKKLEDQLEWRYKAIRFWRRGKRAPGFEDL